MVTDVVPLLVLVTRILDDLGIRYVVGGSLAADSMESCGRRTTST